MAEHSTNYVFMSYSRRDETVMQRITNFLNNEGVPVWLDHEKLVPGTPIWEEEIEKAITAAAAVIVIMSPDSKNSEWVRREISLADQNRTRIFPLLIRGDEDTSISLRLITRQFVDIRTNENEGLKSLSAALSHYLEGLNVQESHPPAQESIETDQTLKNQLQDSSRVVESFSESRANKRAIAHRSIAVLWIALGWAIGGAVGGAIYWAGGDYGDIIGGAIGWGIGGLVTAVMLRSEHRSSNWKNILRIALTCAIGGAIGWKTSNILTEARGAAMGGAIAASIAFIPTAWIDQTRSDWKTILWLVLTWSIAWAIGWLTSRYFQTQLDEGFIGWTIGWGVGGAIGGFVTGWQLMKRGK